MEILRNDEPLYSSPSTTGPRRGAAAKGSRLPLLGAKAGTGCRTDFLLVGSLAWVCGDATRVTGQIPSAKGADPQPTPDGLPRPYYFVGTEGALAYRDIESAGQSVPAGEFQSGFAVSVLRVENGPSGDAFGLTTKGMWLELRDLQKAIPLAFEGYEIIDDKLDRGWVVSPSAPVTATPGGKRRTGLEKHPFDTVKILETHTDRARSFVRVGDGEWLDARDVRVPSLTAPPAEVRLGERWIDVDAENEVLIAYEGTRPVFATLVSTGIGTGDAPTATPLGVHRIWVKLRTTDMTNLEEPDAEHYYAMEDVPWVLFFEKGFGLHGAYWHRSFGHPRSHGCVNLTPLDARRLFEWASPHLPPGWTAALPTEYDPGTLVRVR